MIIVYGIKQCDTCRKALRHLESRGLAHRFHDLRVDGLTATKVQEWMASPIASELVNRRSTTWRGLSDVQKQSSEGDLEALLVENPTLVKRPVFERDGIFSVGFKESDW